MLILLKEYSCVVTVVDRLLIEQVVMLFFIKKFGMQEGVFKDKLTFYWFQRFQSTATSSMI